ARQVHGPRGGAEVSAQLAEDRRHGVSLERRADLRVVARQRVQKADRSDLHQIVERLAGVRVAACKAAHQRQVAVDELGVRALVAAATPTLEDDGLGLDLNVGRVHGWTRAAWVAAYDVSAASPYLLR